MKAPPEDLAERSRALFAELGSQRRISDRTGVSLSRVSRLALGRTTPTTEELLAFRVHYRVSPMWWITGEGERVEELPPIVRRRGPRAAAPEPPCIAEELHAQVEGILTLFDELHRLRPEKARVLVEQLSRRLT